MKKVLLCCLFLLLGYSANAQTEDPVQPVAENVVAETTSTPTEGRAVATENSEQQIAEEQPFETIIHKVEKEILPLPACNDATLLAKTKEFLTEYYAKSHNMGVMFRRRRHFVLNALNGMVKENIANYKTEQARPVSDIIANLKINENVIEENMLLCKKELADKSKNSLFLLVYPVPEGYKVYIVNLDPKHETGMENYFIYQQ